MLLYKLIWDRLRSFTDEFALFHQTTVEIKAGDATFTAAGTVLIFRDL